MNFQHPKLWGSPATPCRTHDIVYFNIVKHEGGYLAHACHFSFTPGWLKRPGIACLSTVDVVHWLSVHIKWKKLLTQCILQCEGSNTVVTSIWRSDSMQRMWDMVDLCLLTYLGSSLIDFRVSRLSLRRVPLFKSRFNAWCSHSKG